MNAEQRTRVLEWAAALRSGEYDQATGQLRRTGGMSGPGYCCLGVACDLWNAGDDSSEWDGTSFTITRPESDRPETFETMPPDDVMADYYGMSVQETEHLADMNDNGESFATIADWLTGRVERSLRIAAANTRRAAASA